ncbi:MAG: Asp-tRNA(Asn)/Glu-tRNA(Gln) amidotransferase subunit GatB, partial [bacterium]|nr:Asp-tRNA(Asn)/Glu-tRNA(Gln) amidotransferase subunit GatB [bacterium]
MKNENYQPVIGLEIHVELKTLSKMFCGCSASHFGVEPNTHCCPVCLGLPGALPVPNRKAVDWTIMLGLALNCRISSESKFDRKNYFYPDLPKGYQITQYDQPLCSGGQLGLKNGLKTSVRRVHLEEDTGKLLHTETEGQKCTLIDFNRSGVPLAEVVTEPDFESIEQVDEFLKKLQLIIRYLGISDADMEKGTMRIEPNISLRKLDAKRLTLDARKLPPYKVEVKNINSFRFVRKAIEFEIIRQTEILEKGEMPLQETRGWNESKNETVSQRSKEEAHDYRYFPEPDIPPMSFDETSIRRLAGQIPELPDDKIERFIAEYKLNGYNAEILCQEKFLADYFEKTVKLKAGNQELEAKEIANWIINKNPDINTISPEKLLE